MNKKTVEVFHALMKTGWIDRTEDSVYWGYYQDNEIQEELECFQDVLGIDLYRTGNRLYMIPTQENDLFLKTNQDYRRDIKADNSVRSRDLYLMNYASIYLIYLFFSGEGSDPCKRDFISKEEWMEEFTKHCSIVEQKPAEGEESDYSENFCQLAMAWLSKVDGSPDSQKFDQRYGVMNRLLAKYKTDDIFVCDDEGLIRPTRKMRDLMPYFLRKERVKEIHTWIEEAKTDAENQ